MRLYFAARGNILFSIVFQTFFFPIILFVFVKVVHHFFFIIHGRTFQQYCENVVYII